MISYDDLFQICVKYSASNYYVDEVIPEKKLANARKHYPVPGQERIVALIDTTVFGSAKTGIVIGDTGLYWRNASQETQRTYLSWTQLAEVSVVPKGILNTRIELGSNIVVELSGSAFSKDEVASLLSEIQYLIRSPSRARTSARPRGRWTLATNGQQLGPYDLSTIRDMLNERRINPDECWVWREGMSNWAQFKQIPALAALLHDLTLRPQTTPPPLPTSESPAPVDSQVHGGGGRKTRRSRGPKTNARHFVPVDLNQASEDELLSLPGITLPISQRLVRERDRRRGFRSVEEAGHFLKLQPHQVQRLKEQALLTPYKGGRPSRGRVVDF